jgi:hypothetical protein
MKTILKRFILGGCPLSPVPEDIEAYQNGPSSITPGLSFPGMFAACRIEGGAHRNIPLRRSRDLTDGILDELK